MGQVGAGEEPTAAGVLGLRHELCGRGLGHLRRPDLSFEGINKGPTESTEYRYRCIDHHITYISWIYR